MLPLCSICDLEYASVVMALAERGDKNNAMATEASDHWTALEDEHELSKQFMASLH